MQPKPMAETSRFPILRFCMVHLLVSPRYLRRAPDDSQAPPRPPRLVNARHAIRRSNCSSHSHSGGAIFARMVNPAEAAIAQVVRLYSRHEDTADLVVHVLGIVFAINASLWLLFHVTGLPVVVSRHRLLPRADWR